MRIVVVGAGVIGLTCAVRLLEQGHRVDVVARDLPLESTSAVAAALWYPYRAGPQDRVLAWSQRSFAVLEQLAASEESAGVRMVVGTEVLLEQQSPPWWASAVPRLSAAAQPRPGYAAGWTFAAPVLEMPVYLAWLHRRVEDLGGTVTRLNLSALPAGPDLVVNCAGIGARLLGADLTVTPVRGQVVRVAQVGLDRWWLDSAGPTYVVPRSTDIVVGGTAEEGEWSRSPSPETATAILARATALVPELEGAQVLGHRVGLRPVRPAVRVERVGRVVHCYGHGGSGVTLSWGCAEDVARLVG